MSRYQKLGGFSLDEEYGKKHSMRKFSYIERLERILPVTINEWFDLPATLALIYTAFICDKANFPSIFSPSDLSLLQRTIKFGKGFINAVYWQIFIRHIVLRFGSRRSFGRFLVIFAVVGIGTVVLSLYTCILPIRLTRWRETGNGLWILLIHAIVGHNILANLIAHFMLGVWLNAGPVPRPLNKEVPRTMCSNCQMPRPLRAHHCSVCNRCVARMDHHCPWLNNCVGLNTHRHFYLFLAYLWIGIFYMHCASFSDFMEHFRDVQNNRRSLHWNTLSEISTWTALLNSFLHALLSALYRGSFLLLMFASALLVWHGYLIGRGETSVEHNQNKRVYLNLKKHNFVFHNPYNFGTLCNWMRFLGLEMPNDIRKIQGKTNVDMRLTYIKRVFTKLIWPLDNLPYDGAGVYMDMNTPNLESALKDLSDL